MDDPDDWNVWKQEDNNKHSIVYTHENNTISFRTASVLPECRVNNTFFSPDIRSVSYQSDGRFFNATLWLTEPFRGPISTDNLKQYQEQLEIMIKDNFTLEKYYNVQKSAFSQITHNNISLNKILSGLPANEINYTTTDASQNLLHKLHIWTEYNRRIYELVYTALNSSYDKNYLSYVNDIIKSFEINGAKNYFGTNENENRVTFRNSEISILYPQNWTITKFSNPMLKFIRYNIVPNINNQRAPHWQEIFVTTSIDIKSVHDTGTDYSVSLTQRPFVFFNKDWFKQLRELSATSQIHVIKQEKIKSPFDNEFSYFIPISVDLKDLNYPANYNVIFSMSNNFVINNTLCKLVDTTNWAIIPPPEYKIVSIPSNLQLSPGESKNILVKITGANKTDLLQRATFEFLANGSSSERVKDDLKVAFRPNHTSILPSSIGTASMSIGLSPSTQIKEPETIDVPIKITISFPNFMKNKRGEEFFNNRSTDIVKILDYVVTIFPPPTSEEQFASFVTRWINPLNNVWTFVFGISSALATIIIYKREKNKSK